MPLLVATQTTPLLSWKTLAMTHVGQSVGSSVVSQNSIAESRQPSSRGNPERTITSNQDASHGIAPETARFS